MAKARRGKIPPLIIEEEKRKELVVPTETTVAFPLDPIYDLSPLERARQMPDVRVAYNSELFQKQLASVLSKGVPELNAMMKKSKNLSIQELMLIQYATHAMTKTNEDHLDRADKLWDRAYGKSAQKIEHSGVLSNDSAMMMETFKGIDAISVDELEAIANLAKEKANAKTVG